MTEKSDSEHIKWMYLTGRGAGIDQASFPAAWNGHADLSGRFPQLMGNFTDSVMYCLLDGSDERFSAAAVLTLFDEDAVRAVLANPAAVSVIHPDEVRVFGDVIARLSFAADEELVTDEPIPDPGAPAAIAWITRAEGASWEQFASELRENTLEASKAVARCVIDWRHDGLFPDSIYAFDAAVELYGGEPGDAIRAAQWLVASNGLHTDSIAVGGEIILNWKVNQ